MKRGSSKIRVRILEVHPDSAHYRCAPSVFQVGAELAARCPVPSTSPGFFEVEVMLPDGTLDFCCACRVEVLP